VYSVRAQSSAKMLVCQYANDPCPDPLNLYETPPNTKIQQDTPGRVSLS
jgi:hypothetical protein